MGKQFTMDMSNESEKKMLLPEGWRQFKVKSCVEDMSKSGNNMFKIGVKDLLTNQDETVYAVAEPGKRWFLKQLLTAAGIAAGEDGVYEWDIDDILEQTVMGRVEHQPDTYINRKGDTVTTTKHKIVEWKALEGKAIEEETSF